jgi:hypothetical protein
MISKWETLLEIQSLEDVLAAPRVLVQASLKITLSYGLDGSSRVLQYLRYIISYTKTYILFGYSNSTNLKQLQFQINSKERATVNHSALMI